MSARTVIAACKEMTTLRLFLMMGALILVLAACGTEVSPPGDDAAAPAQTAAVETTAAPADTAAPTTSDASAMSDDDMDEMHDDEMDDMHDDATATTLDPATPVDREIVIIATEFAFEPSSVAVEQGETVRFVIQNDGAIEHEFRLTTKHSAQEHIEAGHEGHDDEGAAEGEHGHQEMLILIAAGETESMVVTFTDAMDFDVIGCLLPGHYEAGMLADLTIE